MNETERHALAIAEPATLPLLVIIESPFAANDRYTQTEHEAYLRRCIRDSINKGEAPYASHRMYTDALDDTDDTERNLGMLAGLAWARKAQHVAVYCDLGVSPGMKKGIANARTLGITIEYRLIRSFLVDIGVCDS